MQANGNNRFFLITYIEKKEKICDVFFGATTKITVENNNCDTLFIEQ